jgi:hypothetical protein
VDANHLDLDPDEVYSVDDDQQNVKDPGPRFNNDLIDALFCSADDVNSDDEWPMPKLKAPEKDKPISHYLAALIKSACTS